MAKACTENGYSGVKEVATAAPEELAVVPGISLAKAELLIAAAKTLMNGALPTTAEVSPVDVEQEASSADTEQEARPADAGQEELVAKKDEPSEKKKKEKKKAKKKDEKKPKKKKKKKKEKSKKKSKKKGKKS